VQHTYKELSEKLDRGEWKKKKIQRQEENKTRIRNTILYSSILCAAIAVCVGSFLYILYTSSMFNISGWEINDTALISEEAIIEAVHLTKGSNIFKFPIHRAEKILTVMPAIQSVHIHRHYPSVLQINIVERTPIALLNISSGNSNMMYAIDSEGVLMAYEYELSGLSLPVITGLEGPSVSLGDTLILDEIHTLIQLLQQASTSEKPIINMISEINIRQNAGTVEYHMYLTGSQTEIILSKTFSRTDFTRLTAVIDYIAGETDKARIIDLRFEDAPIYMRGS